MVIRINHLEVKLTSRYNEDERNEGNNSVFADLIIDDVSLFRQLRQYDFIPCFGWGSEEQQQLAQDCFLFRYPFEYMYHRYPLLICPECGDLECGYISVAMDKVSDHVEWSNFYTEPNKKSLDIGPFYFQWDDYKAAIRQAYELGRLR